eukprot:CAMPEP_0113303346 /NCGR_PEP_ID=MMETSP0010_2-20120614/3801_1 /TAXON_ID=216773 ORGANISM="Corethron hystrix, Strain 308" /NCGR_SAMPLE_ID=MMETSP0010_2 /ASSEMBLY_ACC=CAM_ASM_000155 /LENGTH=517 /DNA_ID=CAMNT_0000157329 /DNA_START=271 /DNA_END=1825 /DNA_ORIENTATION=- /assembly_acc=CAM_ASM_000155
MVFTDQPPRNPTVTTTTTGTLPFFSRWNSQESVFISTPIGEGKRAADNNSIINITANYEQQQEKKKSPSACSCAELLKDPGLKERLADELGVFVPNEMQSRALELANSGSDIMVVSQTGSGKTLTFLLPILFFLKKQQMQHPENEDSDIHQEDNSDKNNCDGVRTFFEPKALVLAPTKELVAQHEDTFRRIAPNPMIAGNQSLVHFDTPDCFLKSVREKCLGLNRLGIVAFDEADAILCKSGVSVDGGSQMSKMGENVLEFVLGKNQKYHEQQQKQETVLSVSPNGNCDGKPQFILTTAYLSELHNKALLDRFPSAIRVQEPIKLGDNGLGVLVPTLRQEFQYFSGDKDSKFVRIYCRSLEDPFLLEGNTLVFCSTPEDAEHIVELLEEAGKEKEGAKVRRGYLNCINEGMNALERRERLQEFRALNGVVGTLICTEMFARGLDVPNVRHVILFDVPSDVANFVHQVGRTARRGQSGLVTAMVRAGGFGIGGGFNKFQHLHALQDAPKLTFDDDNKK